MTKVFTHRCSSCWWADVRNWTFRSFSTQVFFLKMARFLWAYKLYLTKTATTQNVYTVMYCLCPRPDCLLQGMDFLQYFRPKCLTSTCICDTQLMWSGKPSSLLQNMATQRDTSSSLLIYRCFKSRRPPVVSRPNSVTKRKRTTQRCPLPLTPAPQADDTRTDDTFKADDSLQRVDMATRNGFSQLNMVSKWWRLMLNVHSVQSGPGPGPGSKTLPETMKWTKRRNQTLEYYRELEYLHSFNKLSHIKNT